jgi:hypothetical protein
MSDVLIAGKQDVESSRFGRIEKLTILEPGHQFISVIV